VLLNSSDKFDKTQTSLLFTFTPTQWCYLTSVLVVSNGMRKASIHHFSPSVIDYNVIGTLNIIVYNAEITARCLPFVAMVQQLASFSVVVWLK